MKSQETKWLVHDLSKNQDLEYYTNNYDKDFLRTELKLLASHPEYIYEPARRLLERLTEKGI